MSTDPTEKTDANNPLRQVIINSHAPLVVSEVPADSLYLASDSEVYMKDFDKKVSFTNFSALPDTWRTNNKLCCTAPSGMIKDYLGFDMELKQSFQEPHNTYPTGIKNSRKTVKHKQIASIEAFL